MRKILMMAVLAFLSLQGVGARASGISLLESGKKKLVAQEDTVKKDTVKKTCQRTFQALRISTGRYGQERRC